MFGWKSLNVETSQSALLDSLKLFGDKLDALLGARDEATMSDMMQQFKACDDLIKQLAPTEQSKVGLFWQGVTGGMSTFSMFPAFAMQKMYIPALVPTIKTNVLNTIQKLS